MTDGNEFFFWTALYLRDFDMLCQTRDISFINELDLMNNGVK